jgi:hypothetical protein
MIGALSRPGVADTALTRRAATRTACVLATSARLSSITTIVFPSLLRE